MLATTSIGRRLACVLGCAGLGWATLAIAAEPAAPATPSKPAAASPTPASAPAVGTSEAVGARQEVVQKMLADLEQKFLRLAERIKETEPQQAAKLIEALQQSKQASLQERMKTISALLGKQNLGAASAEQGQVVEQLKKLVDILTREGDDLDKVLEEIRKLEQWKERVDQLIKEEMKEKRETDLADNKDKALGDLDGQIAAVKELIQREQAVADAAEKARAEGSPRLGKIADDQHQVRSATDLLRRALREQAEGKPEDGKPGDAKPAGKPGDAKPSDGKPGDAKPSDGKPGDAKPGDAKPGDAKPGDGKPGDAKPGDAKPGDAKPGDGKPGDAKPGDAKPGDAKPGDAKPGDGKPGDGKPGDGKPGDGKPGDGKPGDGKPGDGSPSPGSPSGAPSSPTPAGPGELPLEQASQAQKSAADRLGEGNAKGAQADAAKAVDELKKALKELEAERNRIATLPPEHLDRLAKDQDNTADRAGDLDKEMRQASANAPPTPPSDAPGAQPGQPGHPGQPGGQPGQPSEGSPGQPGQQNIQQAQKNMRQASQGLRGQQPKGASKDQQKAIEDLEKAKQEIEQRLAQLRQELQDEMLAALEQRFTQMLERQKQATADTTSLEAIRAQRAWRRNEELALRNLSRDEAALADQAKKALEILKEDGTTVVFPQIVEGLIRDFLAAGELLQEQKTGPFTHALQTEIEQTLEELIAALKKAQEQSEGKPGQPSEGGGQPPPPPLVPDSAELKLLKAAQLRVNRLTESLDQARAAAPADPAFKKQLGKLADRQGLVAKMAQDMIERK